MAKQIKKTNAQSKGRKRVEVKGLAKSQKKLSPEEMQGVKGGSPAVQHDTQIHQDSQLNMNPHDDGTMGAIVGNV